MVRLKFCPVAYIPCQLTINFSAKLIIIIIHSYM